MKLLRALLPLVLLSPVALAQNTWYVDDDGNAPGSGSQSDPYTSIQYAIEQSSTQEGDTLMVAPGTYTENIDFQRKALHVMGSSATDRPIIETNSTGGPPVFLVEHTYDTTTCLWHRFRHDRIASAFTLGLASMRAGGVRQMRVGRELLEGATWLADVPRGRSVLIDLELKEVDTR